MSENIKYKVISTKSELEIINFDEAKLLKSKARNAWRAGSSSSFFNYAQAVGAIIEGSRIIGSASMALGLLFGDFQGAYSDAYYFASEVKDLFTDYGYDRVEIKMYFKKIQVIDEGTSGNGNTVLGSFWIVDGNKDSEVTRAHIGHGWDMF